MRNKMFSIELMMNNHLKNGEQANQEKMDKFEKTVNDFLEKNPEFITTEYLQSSGGGPIGAFTRITVVCKK